MKTPYCYGGSESIVSRRLQFDAEERRLMNELASLQSNRKDLHRECRHLSAMKTNGKIVFCQDCGWNNES